MYIQQLLSRSLRIYLSHLPFSDVNLVMSSVLLSTFTAKSWAEPNLMSVSFSSCLRIETAACKSKSVSQSVSQIHSNGLYSKQRCVASTYARIVSNACGLPATVVAAWIGLVQLVAVVFVPAHVQNGHTEWPFATVLRVRLLDVAQIRHQLFAWHRFAIVQLIALSNHT